MASRHEITIDSVLDSVLDDVRAAAGDPSADDDVAVGELIHEPKLIHLLVKSQEQNYKMSLSEFSPTMTTKDLARLISAKLMERM